jgi:rhamnogalacturonyl hydrolase YesR
VRTALEQLRCSQDQADAGLFLGSLPESTRQEYAEAAQDYDLYLYLKLKVAQRKDWDEEGYLNSLPEARKATGEQKYVDGLQHFINEGFAKNASSAWVTENRDAFLARTNKCHM